MATLRLRLLDWPTEVRLPDGSLAAEARRRYASLVCRKPPRLIVEASFRERDGPVREPRLTGGGRFESWSMDGEVRRRRARVRILPIISELDTSLRVIASVFGRARGVVLMHAAAVAIRGFGGVLFPAPDGAGKTTLMLKVRRDRVLGDDQIGVAVRGRPRVLATPFRGGFLIPRRHGEAPLRAICFLDRRAPRGLHRVSAAATLFHLARHVVNFSDDPGILHLLKPLSRLPGFVLSYDAANTSWSAVAKMIDTSAPRG